MLVLRVHKVIKLSLSNSINIIRKIEITFSVRADPLFSSQEESFCFMSESLIILYEIFFSCTTFNKLTFYCHVKSFKKQDVAELGQAHAKQEVIF